MKTLSLVFRHILGIAAFVMLFTASSTRAANITAGEVYATVPVPAGFKGADVQQIASDVVAKRGWEIKSATDKQVVAYYKHHRNEATVTLAYDDKLITISCEGYVIDRDTGARKEPKQPKSWLKYIRQDLEKAFGLPVTK